MKRSFRLTRSSDYERVRRSGTSYAHPFAILLLLENGLDSNRVGIVAGKAVGKAVERNRAKRVLRAAIINLMPLMNAGYDICLVARRPIVGRGLTEVEEALRSLLKKARVIDGTGE